MLASLKRLFSRLFRCGAGSSAVVEDVADSHGPEALHAIQDAVHVSAIISKKPKPEGHCIPPVFQKQYGKVIPTDVSAKEAVCITSDVAVLGDASVVGDTCITGNTLVAGSCTAKGSICITGDVIILKNAHVEGQVCVTGNAFVKGDLLVKGSLKVGGKLCVWGSKDIQPTHH